MGDGRSSACQGIVLKLLIFLFFVFLLDGIAKDTLAY